ncbi:glycine betaine ABC transporter substrate-binding protein [Fodinisporobacter ferrooxydans]|uniref:Glycine betaine ABC transporter substrate-binding protein n=1 Tax=Fodinisporobacter ferrooxydans TaxID=2901836 RepID=A0ABY4CM18_9BACL|nr:glycine betaine ABC transporter substrate-binding protein [Alicyclobacillaceae bacterium MYW30-H2]
MNTKKQIITGFTGAFLAAAVLAGCGANASNPAQDSGDKNITIGYVNWTEDVATTYLWKDLLTEKGYHVTLKNLSLGPLFSGLSENGVNVFFDSWLPEQNQYIGKYSENIENLGQWYTGDTKEGFVVPSYMKNVNSIADLKQYAANFNNQIVGIDPGAVEMQLSQKAISDYGLPLKLVESSAPAMLSSLERAYKEQKPIVVTLWSPHWAFTKYHLKYLSDPKEVFGKAGRIQTEANKTWVTSHPEAAKWLKTFKLTPGQLGTLEEDINQTNSTERGVKKWIHDNQSVINTWFHS